MGGGIFKDVTLIGNVFSRQVHTQSSSFDCYESYRSGFADEKLLKMVLDFIDQRMAHSTMSIQDIGYKVGLSQCQLYRKMKTLTG
ncbi:hypothetical protein C8P68_108111 [Mucilaginibacter yixingensis]|uniref:HTH araC/xylS-type domain-containing protein n=1 Tax=Mucilaginibacter yixingensis TaxID=1295612 RepID=A0A2T5J5V5_9SPHI|nr:hypothetical protein C8P68_108111 [Mucilaginibacter yixingensis]